MANTQLSGATKEENAVNDLATQLSMLEVPTEATQRQHLALCEKYRQWISAQGKELQNSTLPAAVSERRELSLLVSNEIVWRSEQWGSSYKPPLPPRSHPYFPYWLNPYVKHDANRCIWESYEELRQNDLLRPCME